VFACAEVDRTDVDLQKSSCGRAFQFDGLVTSRLLPIKTALWSNHDVSRRPSSRTVSSGFVGAGSSCAIRAECSRNGHSRGKSFPRSP
jgi:hypothetical protein